MKNCIANHDERENRFFVTSIFENAAAKHNKIDYLPELPLKEVHAQKYNITILK